MSTCRPAAAIAGLAGLLNASHIIKGSLVSLAKSEMLAGLGGAAKWKSNMLEKASALFSSRGADLQSYIYSTSALADSQKAKQVLQIPLLDFTSLRISSYALRFCPDQKWCPGQVQAWSSRLRPLSSCLCGVLQSVLDLRAYSQHASFVLTRQIAMAVCSGSENGSCMAPHAQKDAAFHAISISILCRYVMLCFFQMCL